MRRMEIFKVALAAMMVYVTTFANAATYTVDENLVGTFSIVEFGTHNEITHSLTLSSLVTGDPSIFTASIESFVTSQFDSLNGFTFCNGACTFTNTLITGDTFHGTVEFVNWGVSGDQQFSYSGLVNITGGTGLFTGATGSGTFSGVDTFLTTTSGTTTHNNRFTVTTVPEPEAYAMFIAGLMLLIAICRKHFTWFDFNLAQKYFPK